CTPTRSENRMADSNDTVTIATGEGASGSRLMGIGAYRPERVVSNEEICEHIDSSSEWIYERSGILNRRFAEPAETVISMSGEAAKQAVDSAGVDPELVDLVILCPPTSVAQVTHDAPNAPPATGGDRVSA